MPKKIDPEDIVFEAAVSLPIPEAEKLFRHAKKILYWRKREAGQISFPMAAKPDKKKKNKDDSST